MSRWETTSTLEAEVAPGAVWERAYRDANAWPRWNAELKSARLGGPLAEGIIEDGKLICPWHAWAFDPATGATDSSQERVAVYPVTVEAQDVFVKI